MLLLLSFFLVFWLTFLNVFSLISALSQFAAVIIVVKKGLLIVFHFFIAMTIMMVIIDGERSSTSLSFWVCEADCRSLAAMDFVVIVIAIALVYSSSTTIMGG